jgi:4-azaleucine resistance transporter AzlC
VADPPRGATAGFWRGFRAALPFMISTLVGGLFVGVAYRGLGLSLTAAVLFSTLVYSGTAQSVAMGLWAMPPPLFGIVIAGMMANARYLVMGAHLRHLFAGVRKRVMLPILFYMGDASWLMTISDAARNGRDVWYLLGTSVPMVTGWVAGTAIGHVMPVKPGGALAVAASFLPLAFIVTLMPSQWRGRRSLLPWGIAAATGLVVAAWAGPSWAMLVGGGAGTMVAAMRGDDD